ncbi:hypothetical protein [Paraburkholderia hayleyella]|uniref:hypothetical protein n=1 Tax=Paraburkholderia hayleyella TaxID=2152889 RepID=UPI00129231E4|nr:hypothetical protein [Paraburkholderia hayleyella]
MIDSIQTTLASVIATINFSQILPVSVIAAVLLFIFKECLEGKRKRRARRSRKNAFARVIGSEIKQNYASIDSFFKILDFLREHRDCANLKFQFICLRHGYESCVISADRDSLEMTLPEFKTKWYEKLLIELSEQEPEIAEKAERAYDSLYFLSEKRNLLASLMEGELSAFLRMCATALLDLLPPERDRIENELKEAYEALTGKDRIFP